MATDRLAHPRRWARDGVARGTDPWCAREHAARARAAALAFLVVYLLTQLVPLGSRIDEGLRGVHDQTTAAAEWAGALLGTMTPVSVIVIALTLCALAWRRRGRRVGVESALTISAGPAAAELLKAGLPVVDHRSATHWVIGSSFPSGHVATITVLCLTLLTLTPSRLSSPFWGWMLRLLAFALPVAVGASTVIVGWHRPGDVVGGVLVALAVHHGVRALSRRRATTDLRSSSAAR